jgi:hypothetical protein
MSAETTKSNLTAEQVHTLLRDAVRVSDSAFGRLMSVAAMRETGAASVAANAPAGLVERELRLLHRAAFQEWLELPLGEQRRDLAAYLRTVPGGRGILPTLVETGMTAVPPERRDVEEKLFFQDLATVQSSLMVDAWEAPAAAKPESSFRAAPFSLPALG